MQIKKIPKKVLCVHVLGFGAGAAVTSSSGVEFGVLDLVVSMPLSTGKTLDAAMSKNRSLRCGMQRPVNFLAGFKRQGRLV